MYMYKLKITAHQLPRTRLLSVEQNNFSPDILSILHVKKLLDSLAYCEGAHFL